MNKFNITHLIIIIFCQMSFSSGQCPELIILKRDTLQMYSSPLSTFVSFYWWRGIPYKFKKISSTGCYRGYQGLWEIQNDSLFLRNVYSSINNFIFTLSDSNMINLRRTGIPVETLNKIPLIINQQYQWFNGFDEKLKQTLNKNEVKFWRDTINRYVKRIPTNTRPTIDLDELVKNKFIKNGYFAEKFTGFLIVHPDSLLKLVYSGWSDIFDNEKFIRVLKGKVISTYEIETFKHYIKNGFNAHHCENGINFWLPDSLTFRNYYNFGDYLNDNKQEWHTNEVMPFSDKSEKLIIKYALFKKSRDFGLESKRLITTEAALKNEIKNFSQIIKFDTIKYGKIFNPTSPYRWDLPYLSWVYGIDVNSSFKNIISVISNRNKNLFIWVKVANSSKDDLEIFFKDIIANICLEKG